MERLEKIVNRYSSGNDEDKPLIKKVDFPVANEVIIIPNDDYSSCSDDGDDEFDEESGNPRTKRMKKWLKNPCCLNNWKCLENDHPYNTLFKSVVFISSLVCGTIGGIKLYHMYY
jgi:hypothetical protein